MKTHRCSARILCALVTLSFVAACSGGSGTPSTSTLSPQTTTHKATHKLAQNAGWISPAARHCKEKVFVASYTLGYVDAYCTKGHNQAPIEQITNGISGPEGLAVDSKGNLYVTNTVGNDVTEYAPGSVTPSYTYTSDMSYPAGVTVDSKQNVYVSNLSPPSVAVFPQGTNTPTQQLTADLTFPIDVALDAQNNLYVTTYNSNYSAGEIIEYSAGSSQATNLGINTDEPGGIVIDKSGNIVTADQRLPGVLVFPAGKTSSSQTFAQNALDPDPVRFTHNEKQVYVGDSVGNQVYVYDYPSGKLINTITDGVDGPNGIALDPSAPQ